jgi:hypothetical protein
MTPDALDTIRDLEPSRDRQPVERLLVAILQQAVLDYFGGNQKQKRDALRYFQESALYHLALKLFDLPPDALPQGVQPDTVPARPVRKPPALAQAAPVPGHIALELHQELHLNGKPISLLTLTQVLRGNRLHIFLTTLILDQPASIADVASISGVSEDTVGRQMTELQQMGLLTLVESADTFRSWVISENAAEIVSQLSRQPA